MSDPVPSRVLARVDDIPDPGAIVVDVGGEERLSLILARKNGRVFAYVNRCAHARYPLQRGDGSILIQEGRFLICAAHFASYAIETGACAGGPCNRASLTKAPIEIVNGEVRLKPSRS